MSRKFLVPVGLLVSASDPTGAFTAGDTYFNSTSGSIKTYNGAAWVAASGTQGVQGTTGSGIQGIQGIQGLQGIQGAQGIIAQTTPPAAQGILWLDTTITGAAGGSGDLVMLSNTAFSASAAVNIDSLFSSTYAAYDIYIAITGVTSGSMIPSLRFRSGGSTVTSSTYLGTGTAKSAGGGIVSFGPGGGTGTVFDLHYWATTNVVAWITMHRSSSTQYSYFMEGYSNDSIYTTMRGMFTAAADGISIYPSASTITGSVVIYGRKA
jgi:hypothetical protein